MKNKSDSRIVKVLARIFDIRTWFDFERMKTFSLFVSQALLKLFMPKKEADDNVNTSQNKALTESFETAKKEQNLTEKDIENRKNALFRLSLFMLFLAISILVYSGYHFLYGSLKAGILSLVVTFIAIVLAFRYHFWYYQFKSRQLGCSLNEWFRKGLLGGKE